MSSEAWNPAEVEDRIRDVSNRIANGGSVCNKEYRSFLDADRALDAAFARAYMAHSGPAHEKKYAAELATQEERQARDETDATYRYADRQAKALQDELRALQEPADTEVRTNRGLVRLDNKGGYEAVSHADA